MKDMENKVTHVSLIDGNYIHLRRGAGYFLYDSFGI